MAINVGEAPIAMLQPQAAPVGGNFVQAASPERSNLWAVAEALGGLNSDLQGWLDKQRADQKGKDAAAGSAAFYTDNSVGYAEAVKQGKIPAYASPAFVSNYKESEGQLAGVTLAQKFQTEYMAWDGKDGTDPAAFTTFMQGFLQRNITTQDPDVLKGLIPHVRELSSVMGAQFQKDIAQNVYGGSLKNHGALANAAIDNAFHFNLGQPDGAANYGDLTATLENIRQQGMKSGLRQDDVDKQIHEAIIAKALEHRDPHLLDLLDKPMKGETAPWSQTVEGQKAKADAISKMEVLARTAETDNRQAQAAKDAAAKVATTSAVVDAVVKNPGKPVPEELLSAAEKYDATIRVQAVGWAGTVSSGQVLEDKRAVSQVYSDLIAGGGINTITKAMTDGVLKSPESISAAHAFMKSLAPAGGGTLKVLEGKTFTTVMDTLRQRTMSPALLQNPYDPGGLTDDGLAAQTEYQRLLVEWNGLHPNASQADILAAQAKIGGELLKNIDPAQGQSTQPTFRGTNQTPFGQAPTAPVDHTAANNWMFGPEYVQAPPAATPGPQAAPPAAAAPVAAPAAAPPAGGLQAPAQGTPVTVTRNSDVTEEEVLAYVHALTPQQQQAAASIAAASGIPLAELYRASIHEAKQNAVLGPRSALPPLGAPAITPGQHSPVLQPGLGGRPGLIHPDLHGEAGGGTPTATPASFVPGADPYRAAIEQFLSHPVVRSFMPQPQGGQPDMPTTGVTANLMKPGAEWGDPRAPGFESRYLTTVKSPGGVDFRVHKASAPAFQGFLADLEHSGYRISSVDSGGWNIRNIAGTDTLSQHGMGNAIDINAGKNPVTKPGEPMQTNLPANIGELADKWHLVWGGNWHSKKDPMHFEWNGVPLEGENAPAQMAANPAQVMDNGILNHIVQVESSGNPGDKATTSDAQGLGQFIGSTWLETIKSHRPEWAKGKSDDELLALRTDPRKSIEMLARFTEDNAQALSTAGKPLTPANIYLAHFAGAQGALNLLRANPGDPVSDHLGAAAIRANQSVLAGKTVGQVLAWAAKRMATPAPDYVNKYFGAPAPVADPKQAVA